MQNECACPQPCDSGRGIQAFVFVLFILLIILAFQGREEGLTMVKDKSFALILVLFILLVIICGLM